MTLDTQAKPRYHGPPALCSVCGTTLDRAMVAAGYSRHPCCDPLEEPWAWRNGTLKPAHPMPYVTRKQKFR